MTLEQDRQAILEKEESAPPAEPVVRSSVIRNLIAMGAVQVCRKVLPVVTMPYLGRVLGPAGLGSIAVVQGFTVLAGLLIEYGFNLSATRELAQSRQSKQRRAELLSGVLGAQALLVLLAFVSSYACSWFIPILSGQPRMLLFGILFCIADSCNPYWYFQGMERMGFVAAFEIGAKALAAGAIFALVRGPDQAWIVLAAQAAASFLATSIALAIAIRESGVHRPSVAGMSEAIRKGWPMFLFRSADSLYALGNSFVLGLFVSPVLVGYYAGSEKISKAIFGLMNPIREALYPRLSSLVKDSPAEAARWARIGIVFMGTGV